MQEARPIAELLFLVDFVDYNEKALSDLELFLSQFLNI